MNLYLFPVEYKKNNLWDERMVQNWIESKLSYLTFSFNRFLPKFLPKEHFWLYLYYCKGSTDIKDYKGMTIVNSRPICTSDSRIDMYHQKEYGGG